MTQLSPHFAAEEFRSHDGTRTPPRWLHWAQELCTAYLEPLRSEFGPVTIVSGHRSTTHNRDVGGAPRSFHLRRRRRRGAAADVVCAQGSPAEWHAFLDDLGIPGLGLYSDHVHADNRAGRARW
jgi:zinc D-Ala-D-Ala carboxypeptidase